MTVTSSSIDLKGSYSDGDIDRIIIAGSAAELDTEAQTFKFSGLSLPNSENDIVIKLYDSEKNILGKYVYTFYTTTASAGTTQ